MKNAKDNTTPIPRSLRSTTPTTTSTNSPDEVSMSKIEALISSKIDNAISQIQSTICLKLDKIFSKVEEIERKMENVQVEQLRLSVELDKVKEIIIDQQRIIERNESANRLPYLIISGVPESNVMIEGNSLTTDVAKVNYLFKTMCNADVDLQTCARIGKNSNHTPRLI